jgi:hypothetical protein
VINKPRNQSGSTLIIIILTVAFILLPLLMVLSEMGLYAVDRSRIQSIVEAASLLAANDVSRIVINDPHFGYVGLSSYPPIGKGICAADGEPLPVTGINTLVGTIRQNTIVARELGNDTMYTLAGADSSCLKTTIKELNAELSDSLAGGTKTKWTDIQGATVDPVKDATAFLRANLPGNIQLESVQLSNGWLAGGSTTTINLPQPERLAQVKAGETHKGGYSAFTNIPVGDRSFTFAGLGSASSIVSTTKFRPADANHICSIVKLDCTFILRSLSNPNAPLNALSRLQYVACCQPFSMPDAGPAGVMTVRFSGEPVRGMQSWSDFLTGNFRDNQVITYDVANGDYPVDKEARMRQSQADSQPGTNQMFAEHLYDWLRNGHLRPRVDAVLAMMNEPFRPGPVGTYAYEFAKDGSISRRFIEKDPFPVGVTSDAQLQTVVDTSLQSGFSPVIVFRNNVKHLGTVDGGKHAGQPLAGNPLNWCELSEYGGDEHSALGLSKGRLATRLTVIDPSGAAPAADAINNVTFNIFKSFDGKNLFLQPRRSFYSGGLAMDIEIGGTRASTASLDVASMRKLRFARKI